jgi:hypothetical protein
LLTLVVPSVIEWGWFLISLEGIVQQYLENEENPDQAETYSRRNWLYAVRKAAGGDLLTDTAINVDLQLWFETTRFHRDPSGYDWVLASIEAEEPVDINVYDLCIDG